MEDAQIDCPRCTYNNPIENIICDMCEYVLDGGQAVQNIPNGNDSDDTYVESKRKKTTQVTPRKRARN